MMISGRESFTGASWKSFSATDNALNLNYCNNGSTTIMGTTVFVKFRHSGGYESSTISETVAMPDCTGITEQDCDQVAEDKYTINIKPAITASCQNCHGNGANGIRLNADEPTQTRTNLLNYTGMSSTTLIQKMNGTVNHGGGVQAVMSAEKINTWFNAENICP